MGRKIGIFMQFFNIKTITYDLTLFITKNSFHRKKTYKFNYILIFKHIKNGVEERASQILLLLVFVINLDWQI